MEAHQGRDAAGGSMRSTTARPAVSWPGTHGSREVPKDFKLTDDTLASLANCALDLGPAELADSTYVKRLRQRERNGGK